jgi:imidazolonepropionase-like amidohydrolase
MVTVENARVDDAPSLHVRGRLLPEDATRDVFIVRGRFTFAPVPDARTVVSDGFVIPGLVDAHAHLGLNSPVDADGREAAEASARAHLHAGVLVVREPGGPDRSSIGIGPDIGLPRVQTAGHFLAPFGGYFPGLAREIDPDELPEAAVEEARASGAWAKAIGDFVDENGELVPNFRIETLASAVRAVHALGARFAMHCVGEDSIARAIEAGVDTIEHATMLSDDHIREMARLGTALTPTMSIAQLIPGAFNGLFSDAQMDHIVAGLRAQPQRVRDAHAAGVRILAGTDAGMGAHGMVRREMKLLREAGLPADVVLAAGSWDARRYLGYPVIEEGAPADLVVFDDDPRDPDVLVRPRLIVLDGRVINPSGQRPRTRSAT